VLRIVPAYWLALVFFVVLLPRQVQPAASGSFGTFAGFGQIYSPGNYYRGLSVAWTLDIELCFYAIVPIVALCVQPLIPRGHGRRLDGLWLLVLGLGSVAVRQFSPGEGTIGGTILGYYGWFAIGMALALVVADPTALARRMRLRPAILWSLAAAGYLLLTDHLAQPGALNQTAFLEYCGLGVLATLVVLTAINASGNKATAVGKWLGDRSYGVYLWHYPIVAWLAGKNLSGWQYLSAALCLTLLAANLSFRCVELPLMRRAASLGRRAPRIGVQPVSARL
jgi:peptidoglycan/LPS O-acetylase OafA/YrhL